MRGNQAAARFVACAAALIAVFGCRQERLGEYPQLVTRPPEVSRSSLEFRLVVREPESGSIELKGPTGAPLVLASMPIVTERDITRVEIDRGLEPTYFVVLIHVRPEAARRLYDTSRENIGGNMAIVVDGKVLMAPKITSVFSSAILIEGSYSLAKATEIAQRLSP